MMRCLFALLILFACTAATAPEAAPAPPIPHWTPTAITALRQQIAAAPADALPAPPVTALDTAQAGNDPATVDRAATALALQLARLHLLGCADAAVRTGWHITDSDRQIDLTTALAEVLASTPEAAGLALDSFFAGLRPQHADYAALRRAYAIETDPARHLTLALNMERWRWLPHALGADYLLVNAAAFEVGLWRKGGHIASWPVIVGKPASPTPVFAAIVSGVTINPWWDVPANIVRESIGALTRNHPTLARQRGYVWGNGHYRQRPGPGNSLGQMKLAMPNPFSVYLHDTPDKRLFAREQRAFSHGCVRVGNALDFAAALLTGVIAPADLAAQVASGRTETLALAIPLPVYIAYFTATADEAGTVRLLPDIYRRDSGGGAMPTPCAY